MKYLLLFLFSPLSVFSQTLVKKWETDTIFKNPESVIYDPKQEALFVSNINGGSSDNKGKGFISKISPQGKIENMEWGKGLDAPHGMAIYKDTLYVADATKLTLINRTSGEIIKRIDAVGAKYLNDVSCDESGSIFISDIFAKKIYNYHQGKMNVWLDLDTLSMPNGILCLKDHLKLLDFPKGICYDIDYKSKRIKAFSSGTFNADGIVQVSNGFLISGAWQGEIFFANKKGETKTILKLNKLMAADIWYIKAKNLLVIPTLHNNSVIAYKLLQEEAE